MSGYLANFGGYAAKKAYKYAKAKAGINGNLSSVLDSVILGPAAGKKQAIVSPAKAIQSTNLGRYLDKSYVKKCGVEVKQQDTAAAPAITTSLATYQSPFLGVVQGVTDASRVGNSFEIKSLRLHCTFAAGATSTGCTLVRVMVFKQGQMQLAALTGAAVLVDPTNIRSDYIVDKQRSFTVLKDFTFKLSAFSSGDEHTTYRWNWTYRPKGCHKMTYTQADTTGVIGDVLGGNLQIMVMYEQTGVASGPTSACYYRCEWVDV